ncbi:MAG: hypothetical protein AAGC95_06860 [Pseudomonadota bacterium]
MLLALPLLFLGLLYYTAIVFTVGAPFLDKTFFTINMMSGDIWVLTHGHVFIMVSLGLLFVELIRSTKTGAGSIINHARSMGVFVIGLLLFVMVKGFGNSIFFIFLLMTLLDVMAGFIVTIVTARRDFSVAEGALGAR